MLLATTLYLVVVLQSSRRRVGDGGEYYALYYAWDKSHRPWMSESSYRAYADFVRSGDVVGAVPARYLREMFPMLQVDQTADFNHFWFYSLLAYLVSRPFNWLGASLDAHDSFLLLHLLLLLLVVVVARRLHGRPGVVCALALTFLSPALWYADKVHTEFFTHCTALGGVMFALKGRYTACAVMFAACATQNPSFGAVAVVALVLEVVGWRRTRPKGLDVTAAAAALLLLSIHPLYYLWRYSEPTPQLLAGGAEPGTNLNSAYVWFVDPDVGLLPNWPLGALLLVVAATTVARPTRTRAVRALKSAYGPLALVVVYLLSSVYAQSSTTNLNSGASIGVARYALWYIPLFFPLALHQVQNAASRGRVRAGALGAVALVIAVGYSSRYLPERPEHYTSPSWTSEYIQRHLPWLYSPPTEIFAERYSGVPETQAAAFRGVLGPDCRKLLVVPGPGRTRAAAPARCGLSTDRLFAFSESLASDRPEDQPFYVRLQERDIALLRDHTS